MGWPCACPVGAVQLLWTINDVVEPPFGWCLIDGTGIPSWGRTAELSSKLSQC